MERAASHNKCSVWQRNRRNLSGLPLKRGISFLLKSRMPLQIAPWLVSHKLHDVPQVVLCPGGTKTLELSQVGHEDALEQLQIKYSAFGAFIEAFLRPN